MSEGVIDGQFYQAPHCNSEVLHAPGQCYYCDHYPDRQAARAASGGSFSPLDANGWSGNVAVKAGEVHEHMGARYTVSEYKRPGRLRRWIIARRLGLRCLVCNRRAGYGGVCPNPEHNG